MSCPSVCPAEDLGLLALKTFVPFTFEPVPQMCELLLVEDTVHLFFSWNIQFYFSFEHFRIQNISWTSRKGQCLFWMKTKWCWHTELHTVNPAELILAQLIHTCIHLLDVCNCMNTVYKYSSQMADLFPLCYSHFKKKIKRIFCSWKHTPSYFLSFILLPQSLPLCLNCNHEIQCPVMQWCQRLKFTYLSQAIHHSYCCKCLQSTN